MNVFKAGLLILMLGIAIAVIPFREEMVQTEHLVQISNWTASWYLLTIEPTEEFTGVFLGNSTLEPLFMYDWGDKDAFGGVHDHLEFIAKADIDVPIDGYVKFEILSGDGARLYIDGDLVIEFG